MEKGKVVGAIPAPNRFSRYKINWDEFAKLAKVAGSPVLVGHNIRETQVKSMRLYKRPPFVMDDGHIKIALRNSIVKDGAREGDVYFEWVPTEKKEG